VVAVLVLFSVSVIHPVMAAEENDKNFGEWTITPIGAVESLEATSFAMSKTGVPQVSYYDDATGSIMYATKAGTAWHTEKVADSAGTYMTSVAIDPAGNPAISFGDGLHFGNLMYAQKNGTHWDSTIVAKGSVGDAGQYSSLAFDAAGNPHIAYNDGQNFARLRYASWNASSKAWEYDVIDSGGDLGDTGYNPSLVFDAGGVPHVAYRDGKKYPSLMYAVKNGANWTTTVVDNGGDITGNTGYSASLALDTAGNPHIAYYDQKNEVLRYASWNGTGWKLEWIERNDKAEPYTSLAIDAQNIPHIGYPEYFQNKLKYATYNATFARWDLRLIDTPRDAGKYAKIALDPAGHPNFIYYDATKYALNYVTWTAGNPKNHLPHLFPAA